MSRIFIDLTGDEHHWNGDIPVSVREHDELSGADMAIAIGDHQIVLTVSQVVTLFEVLDGWLNGGPVKEVGGIKQRLHAALHHLVEDRRGVFRKMFGPTFTEEQFVGLLVEYIGLQGLRFRVTGDEPAFTGARP